MSPRSFLLFITFVVSSAFAADAFVANRGDSLPAALPTEIVASYKVSRNGLGIGTATETLERTGTHYRITSVTRTDGAIAILYKDELTQVSEGRIDNARLKPDRYSYSRARAPKKNFVTLYSWDAKQIERSTTDSKETFPLHAQTQDRLSVLYQFIFSPPRADTVELWMSSGKEATQYLYKRRGEAPITTAIGEMQTVHYARESKPGESKAQLWLAKGRAFVPAKVVFEEPDGTVIEQTLTSLSVR